MTHTIYVEYFNPNSLWESILIVEDEIRFYDVYEKFDRGFLIFFYPIPSFQNIKLCSILKKPNKKEKKNHRVKISEENIVETTFLIGGESSSFVTTIARRGQLRLIEQVVRIGM